MKKYFIAFGLFCLSLFLINDVYAATTTNWAQVSETIKRPQILFGNFCTSSTSCNGTSMPGNQRDYPWSYSFSSFSTPKNGFLIGFNTQPIMKKDGLYSASIYICHNNTADWELDDIRTGNSQQTLRDNTYPSTIYTTAINSISGIPQNEDSEYTNCSYLQAIFRSNSSGQYLGFKLDHSKTIETSDVFYGYSLDYLGSTDGLNSNDVKNVIDSSGLAKAKDVQEIKEKQEEVKQELENTKEQIKEGFEECHDSYNLFPYPYSSLPSSKNGLTSKVNDDKSVTITGTATADTYFNFVVTSKFFNSTIYATALNRCNNGYCLANSFGYDNNNNTIFYYFKSGAVVNTTIYPMITTEANKFVAYEPPGEQICQNRIDKQTEQQNKNHKETMDYMKDDSDIDTSEVDNLVGYLPAGPLDSIINLPLSMLNAISSNLSKSCVAPTFKVPFVNENFTLPCISDLYEKMGATTLLNSLGGIAAAVMLYKYFVYLYNWVDHVLSLRGDKLKGWGE